MRFSSEVYDMGDVVPFDYFQRGCLIAQIHLLKNILGMMRDLIQVFQSSGIRQAIEVDELRHLRMINEVLDQVCPNKSGATGNEQIH